MDVSNANPMDVATLEELLQLLERFHVAQFEGMGVTLTLLPQQASSSDSLVPVRTEPKSVPRSMWENEGLWPGGKPPSFPR